MRKDDGQIHTCAMVSTPEYSTISMIISCIESFKHFAFTQVNIRNMTRICKHTSNIILRDQNILRPVFFNQCWRKCSQKKNVQNHVFVLKTWNFLKVIAKFCTTRLYVFFLPNFYRFKDIFAADFDIDLSFTSIEVLCI